MSVFFVPGEVGEIFGPLKIGEHNVRGHVPARFLRPAFTP